MMADTKTRNRRLMLALMSVGLMLFGFAWTFVTWLHRH